MKRTLLFLIVLIFCFVNSASALHRTSKYDVLKRKAYVSRDEFLSKDDFLSNTSHELRTPLTAIKEASSMLIEGTYDGAPEQEQRPADHAHVQSGDHQQVNGAAVPECPPVRLGECRIITRHQGEHDARMG